MKKDNKIYLDLRKKKYLNNLSNQLDRDLVRTISIGISIGTVIRLEYHPGKVKLMNYLWRKKKICLLSKMKEGLAAD